MPLEPHEDYVSYPEATLRDRFQLAYDWIPSGCRRLLDGGCAFGYATRLFQQKSNETYGVDPNAQFVAVAQKRYPQIKFFQSGVEKTPFEDSFFDTVILNDVFEHVRDEKATLNEMFRVLAPGGTFIMTTPHKGLFGFMDPDNHVYRLRTYLPWLYRLLFRIKYGRFPPSDVKPGYETLHRHYSLKDFTRLLDASDFGEQYQIEAVFRGGLLLGALTSNVSELLSLALGPGRSQKLVKPLTWLADREYRISFGPLAYNIGLRIKKLPVRFN